MVPALQGNEINVGMTWEGAEDKWFEMQPASSEQPEDDMLLELNKFDLESSWTILWYCPVFLMYKWSIS